MLITLYRAGYRCGKLKEKEFQAGQIVTFLKNNEISICNDKQFPIGFLSCDSSNMTQSNSNVSFEIGPGQFRTDVFEPSVYKINDYLYCSKNGKITNEKKYKGNIILGIVNFVGEANAAYDYEPNSRMVKVIGFEQFFARNIE